MSRGSTSFPAINSVEFEYIGTDKDVENFFISLAKDYIWHIQNPNKEQNTNSSVPKQ